MGNMSLRNLFKLFRRNNSNAPATSGSSESISSGSSSDNIDSGRHSKRAESNGIAVKTGVRHLHGRRRRAKSQNVSASSVNTEFPHRLDVLLDKTPVGIEEQKEHGWNKNDKSPNVFVKNDGLTVHRYPVAQSSDACRGKIGYTRGLHCWEITWDTRQRGTHAIVGVCTREAPLTCFGYRSLIGMSNESWGWDLGRNKLYHGGKAQRGQRKSYPSFLGSDQVLDVPKTVMVVLDMEAGTLAFVADNRYLGVAFSGLKGKTVYPVVSCVWGNCEIAMKYINGLDPKPLPLAELCRRTIRQSMGKVTEEGTQQLPIPPLLQGYIMSRKRATPYYALNRSQSSFTGSSTETSTTKSNNANVTESSTSSDSSTS